MNEKNKGGVKFTPNIANTYMYIQEHSTWKKKVRGLNRPYIYIYIQRIIYIVNHDSSQLASGLETMY